MRRDISGWSIRWDDDQAERLRGEGWWTGKTIADYARERVAATPDKVLVVERERAFTVGQLWDEANTLARALVARGLRPGDTITFQLPNWAEAVVINLAAALAGLVVHPIIPIYRDAETAFMLRDCRSKLIFLPREFRGFDYVEMIDRVSDKLEAPVEVVVVRGDPGRHRSYADLLASAPADAGELPGADPDAVKLIMYTSGTTGRAKGVLHTHNSLQAENVARIRHLGLGPDDVMFNPTPVTHVTGYLYSLVLPWMAGLQTVMLDVWEAELGLGMMRRRGCTGTVAATIFLQQLVAAAKSQGESLPALRFFLCGGAQVPPDLIREAAATFPNCAPARIYGSTEVPCITAGVNARAMLEQGAETDGELCFGEARIVDAATGAPVAPGGEGEIIARAPQMFVGYARDEDNAGAFDPDGFFHMGDLGRFVEGRFIVVTGRKKDIIIRAGENISPKEVEDILLGHPDIDDIAIVAMPDERTGEAACAFVIPKPGRRVELPEIRRYLVGAGLAMQKIPERVELVTEFPRTAVGKVRKDILRDRAKGLRRAPTQTQA
ncbi:AMP-binding protein [Alsobacter soli]|nr:AMP-binding protein [Alsobacter soli]